MKQYIYILALIVAAIMGLTQAHFFDDRQDMSFVQVYAEEMTDMEQEMLASAFESNRNSLNMDDFLKQTFDPVNNAVDKQRTCWHSSFGDDLLESSLIYLSLRLYYIYSVK